MRLRRIVLPILLLSLAAPAAADVTIKTRMKSGGFRGFGAFEGTSTRVVKGDKARDASDLTYSGKLMRMAAPPKDAVRITRIDLDKVWEILPSKKSYSERSISGQLRNLKEGAGAGPASEPGGRPEREAKPTHRIKKSEFTVNRTGEKKSVNGFACEKSEIRLTVEVEEIATTNVSTYKLETDVWTTPFTPELRKALDEETKFAQAYMKKLGLSVSPKDQEMFNPAAIAMMLGVDQENAEKTVAQTKKKMESISGYPIVTDGRWFASDDPRVTSARKEAAAKKAAEEDEPGLDLSGGVQGAAGGLMAGFAKKKLKANQAKREEARAGQPIFSTYHEVISISGSSVPADAFEVPPGFKKIDR